MLVLRIFCLSIGLLVGQWTMAQCLKGNCHTGIGTYRYPSGAIYTGDFLNGKIHGTGILRFSNGDKYKGMWKEHYRTGYGELYTKSGDVFKGNFLKNHFEGKGTMQYRNGDLYVGEWHESKAHGQGEYRFSNGAYYIGSFVRGLFEGFGVYHYQDGSSYTGQWSRNMRHGQGKFVEPSGKIIAGTWHQDRKVDTLVETPLSVADAQGQKRNCNQEYCDTGYGIYTYEDGSYYEGSFVLGLPSGKGICYYANGDKYIGGWKHHAPHGQGVMYFAGGKAHGAYWEDGKPVRPLQLRQEVKLKKHILKDVDPKTKIWALVVGVSKYEHMPRLRYTDDDAYRMYAFFKSPEGGALPADQISVLIDEEATRNNIIQAMQNLFLKADESDVVILYFSGHGLQGSFIPIDYNGYENKLRHDEIKMIMDQSSAKNKICLADACYSGSFVQAKNIKNQLPLYYHQLGKSKSGAAFMMSSSSGEVSLEGSSIRQGVFSHYLMRGLAGEADTNGDHTVVLSELFDFVHDGVSEYTANSQTPVLFGTYDKNLPMAFVRKGIH